MGVVIDLQGKQQPRTGQALCLGPEIALVEIEGGLAVELEQRVALRPRDPTHRT